MIRIYKYVILLFTEVVIARFSRNFIFQDSDIWRTVAYYVSNDTMLNMLSNLNDSHCFCTSHC